MIPFVVGLVLWVAAAGLVVWAVVLLRRISRSLDRIADALERHGSNQGQ